MASYQKLKSGKFRVQVRRGEFYRSASFDTKTEAKTWAAKIETMANGIKVSGYATPPKEATLGKLIELYQSQNPDTNYGRTKLASLNRLAKEFCDVRIVNLSRHHLRDFIDKRVKTAGGVTIAQDLSYLSTVLSWARHVRQLDVNPEVALDARKSLKHRDLSTRSTERTREPTPEELTALYEDWESRERMSLDMPRIVRFAIATAMRLGEICNLQIEDINRKNRTVLIRDRKDPRKKNGNNQLVPLLPDAWALIEPLIEGREEGKVFVNTNSRSASAAFTRACNRLKIKDLHFHDLRHLGTISLFRQGLDIPEVALMTGHKTWTMLRRYTLVKPTDVLNKIEKGKTRAEE